MARPEPPSVAVPLDPFHTWLAYEGRLFDFAARALPAKLARAKAPKPFPHHENRG